MARNAVADGDRARGAAHAVGGVGAGAAELDGDVAARGAGEDGERERRIHRARSLGAGRRGSCARRAPRRRARCPSSRPPGRDPRGARSSSASASAMRVAATVNWEYRSSRRARRSSMWSAGTKSGTSPAIRDLNTRRIEPGDAADRRRPPPEPLPQPVDAQPDRRDRPDARDHHPPRGSLMPLLPPPPAGCPPASATRCHE